MLELEPELPAELPDELELPLTALATPLSRFEAVVATPLTAPAAVVVTPLTTPDAALPTGAGRLPATVDTVPPAWVTPLATVLAVEETAPARELSGEVVVDDAVVVALSEAGVVSPSEAGVVVAALGCAAVVAAGVVALAGAVEVVPARAVVVLTPPALGVPVDETPEWLEVPGTFVVGLGLGLGLVVGHALALALRRDLAAAALARACVAVVCVVAVRVVVRRLVVSVCLAGVALAWVAWVPVAVSRRVTVAHAVARARAPELPPGAVAPEVAEIWAPPLTAAVDGDRAAARLALVAAVFADAVVPGDSDGPATIWPKLPR